MFIKGISKVLIVSIFLISLFLFSPQRVEAVKGSPEKYCTTNGFTVIDGFIGNPDRCCPTTEKWKTIIPQAQGAKDKDIKTVTNVEQSYLSLVAIGHCLTKYDAITNKGTTISGQTIDINGELISYKCPSFTCEEKSNSNEVVACYTQNEQKDNNVCCIEPVDIVNGYGTFKPIISCHQALNVPVPHGAQFSPAPINNLTTRDAPTICKEDANGNTAIEIECNACFNKVNPAIPAGPLANLKTSQWTALGCINTGEQGSGLVGTIMQIFYGVGFVFILIKFILAGIQLQSGEPEEIKEAKEIFIAGFSALFVAGFGLILLRYIGFDILGIGTLLGNSFPTVRP